jgi:CheY-like chemotaxis protein
MNTTTLLLVSDPIVRSIFKETLEHEGYMVVAAGDLGQAVDRMKECPPDLLITRTYFNLAKRCKGFEVFPRPHAPATLI